mgnify:CR=1 FL=1
MNRRRRAIAFGLLAALSALLAIGIVNGYSKSVEESYGELRAVVVVTGPIEAGQRFSPAIVASRLETRLVPRRFSPAGSIADARRAAGLEAAAPLLVGSYLTVNLLRRKQKEGPGGPLKTANGRHAVELSVSGAGALGNGGRVDVLVTSEPVRGPSGQTYVAARAVPLLAVGQTGASAAGVDLTTVTLGLSRDQAVDLVQAQSFARRLTVIPAGGSK